MPATPPSPVARVLPVVVEELAVGREQVRTSTLRVRVVPRTDLRTLALEATQREVALERVPVGREVDRPREPWLDGDTWVVPVYEERLVVQRRWVLTEEIRLHRRTHRRRWEEEVAVRRDEVHIERHEDGSASAGTAPSQPSPISEEYPMKQTVVGVFDRYAAARHAAELLRQRGIAEDDIHVTAADEDGDAASTSSRTADDDTSLFQKIRNFFSGTVDDDDEMSVYSEHVRRGGAVVAVDIEDDPQIEVAREALESAGAVDIDDRVSEWRASGWGGDSRSAADDDVDRRAGSGVPAAGLAATGMGIGTAGTGATGSTGTATPRGRSRKVATDATPSMTTASPALAGDGTAANAMRPDTAHLGRPAGGDEGVIPVVQEDVQVGKRAVKTGGVRVYARVVEDHVRESLDLREEHARVERRPVDRPASEAELQGLSERTIEVDEIAERPVVQKTARVVEEVVVGKEVGTRRADIDETVRRTEIDVQQLPGDATAGIAGRRAFADYDDDFRADWQTRYGAQGGRWEDYEPAYRYGHTMASDERYRGRDWDAVEADARSDWERRHSGETGTWDRMKASVRHAWERAKS